MFSLFWAQAVIKKKSILPYLYPLFFSAMILHLGCTLKSSGEFEKAHTPGCRMRDSDLPGLWG